MANRQRSLSMSDAIRMSPSLFRRQLPSRLARAAEETQALVQNFFSSLPKLTEKDLIALNEADSSCPICLTSFLAILAEEETAIAMDSPAHPIEELGVTRLSATIRNWLSQGRNSCPTCRRRIIASIPGENIQVPELLDVGQEMRQIGGLLPLTDEQSEALGAAVLLLAQGDTDSQLDFPPVLYNAHDSDDRHNYGGIRSTLASSGVYELDGGFDEIGGPLALFYDPPLVPLACTQTSTMAAVFKPNRSLLNSKFDGYKLDAIDHDKVVSTYPLTHKLSQIAPSAKSPLTFQEVQSRIRHNHLCIGPDGRVSYIDAELRVIGIIFDDATLTPSYEVLYELPHQIMSGAGDAPHREYPSSAFLDPQTLFVSDGTGTLYALRLQAQGPAQLLNSFELSIPEEHQSAHPSVPFRVHCAVRAPDGQCTVLLSSKHYSDISPAEDTASAKRSRAAPQFDIWAVNVDLDTGRERTVVRRVHRRKEGVHAAREFVISSSVFLHASVISTYWRRVCTYSPRRRRP
ncbi:hypothetical protein NM688_g7794 [Phlebia brevispora]|uniref:Uncharacterized protein n=1 Tax=Phlebia brevispora TaxID=194682 RepID=A0ACC1S143_9APHY|nr:hypothetical protein NM688_g7794 [Phlebia brevispora]